MQTHSKRHTIKSSQRFKNDEEIARLQQLIDGIRKKREQAVSAPKQQPHCSKHTREHGTVE